MSFLQWEMSWGILLLLPHLPNLVQVTALSSLGKR